MKGLVKATVGAAAIALAAVLPARADRAGDVERLLHTVFRTADADRDGLLEDPEIKRFADKVFASMDADSNGRLTHKEFETFSFGLRKLAERYDRSALYSDARERVWQRWRRPKRSWMTKSMFRQDVRGDFLSVAERRFAVTFKEFKRTRFVRELTDPFR